ncbi:hypothetical protein SH139x_003501 [Planctomycetaceae bacterium SH139]
MKRCRRRGLSLLDTLLAAGIGASLLVPTVQMTRDAQFQQRRNQVREEMAVRGEGIIDAVRIAVGDPASFAGAASGILPAGVAADRTVNFLPGDSIRQRVSVQPYDSQRDLLTVAVTLEHLSVGATRLVPPVRFVTQIARPW